MTREDTIVNILIEANPVPDPAQLVPIPVGEIAPLTPPEQESYEVTRIDEKPTKSPDNTTLAWMIAAILALVIGVGVVLISQRTGEAPATQPTPTSIAEATPATTQPAPTTTIDLGARNAALLDDLVAAVHNHDETALLALPWFSEGAMQQPLWFLRFGRAANSELVGTDSCSATESTSTCSVSSRDDISRAIDPDAAWVDEIRIILNTSGQIQSAIWTVNVTGALEEFLTAFESANTGIYSSGICAFSVDKPVECLAAHMGFVPEWLNSQDG